MRKAGSVVAQNDRVSNSGAPPFVLIRDATLDAATGDHHGGLTGIYAPYRIAAEAHRLIDRERTDVIRKDEAAAAMSPGQRWRVESRPAKLPIRVRRGDELGRDDNCHSAAFEPETEQGTRAHTDAGP